MISTLLHLPRFCPFLCGGHRRPALEHLALRQPLTGYERTARRPPLRRPDQSVWVWLSRVWTRIVREAPHDLNANDQIGSGDFEPNVGSKIKGYGVNRNPLLFLVAGAGFEPATFGL